jgi:four helix bundle protein
MSTIKRFEDIEAWQRARELTAEIYKVTKRKPFSTDFNLRDQIRRASISIMLNIAEGFARRTDKEFAQFLTLAHGSAAEVQAALYVALDQEYVKQKDFDDLYSKVGVVSRMILGFASYLRKKK